MNIFGFINKEKSDIQAVDVKLQKFETIFQGTVSMSTAVKKLLEIFMNRLDGVQHTLQEMLGDNVIGMFLKAESIESEVIILYKGGHPKDPLPAL